MEIDMHNNQYQIARKPFQANTNPAFHWLSDGHREALATLQYGIAESKSFLLLTGEPGVGKTTIVNTLVANPENENRIAVVNGIADEPLDFFNHLAKLFGMHGSFTTKGPFVTAFQRFLKKCRGDGKHVLLIIDDCQLLSDRLLEEIRLLSNLEENGVRLMVILLVGRHEFVERLLRPENRGIKQKVTASYSLEPFDMPETTEYIKYRMSLAGVGRKIFANDAISEIYRVSGGNPRLINVLADHALSAGCSRSSRYIGADIVRKNMDMLDISEFSRNLFLEADKPAKLDTGSQDADSKTSNGHIRTPAEAIESYTKKEVPMDKVLIVDDDTAFLDSMKTGLEKFHQFEIHLALSESEAVSVLNDNRISVLVVRGDTLSINSIELLSYMSRYHGRTPCIVMVSHKKPWFRSLGDQKAFLYYIEKPFGVNALASAIIVGLNQRELGINENGMNMASLLPLFELLGKTGSFQARTPVKRDGRLFFNNGRITNAQCDKLRGEAAAREIAAWCNVTFDFRDFEKHRPQQRSTYPKIMQLVDASWQMEEKENEDGQIVAIEELMTDEHKKDAVFFKELLSDIKPVKGYKGIAFFDSHGNILAMDENTGDMDLAFMSEIIASFYVMAETLAANIDMKNMNAFTLHAKNGHVLVRMLEAGPGSPVYALVVCAFGGNWFYLKNRLDSFSLPSTAAMPASDLSVIDDNLRTHYC